MAIVYRTVARRRAKVVATPKATLRVPVIKAPDLSSLSKAELVTLATERGVDASGTKAEIAARLSDG